MKVLLRRFAQCESGATAIEYALLASLIGVTIITTVTAVGGGINNTMNTVAGSL